jgi:hypothetical protein
MGYGAVDLDNVAVWIEEEELRETGRAVAADHNAHRVVLRRVFAKTVGNQQVEGALEIISAEGKMAIGTIDVACPERAVHLQGVAGEPGASVLERRPLEHREAE